MFRTLTPIFSIVVAGTIFFLFTRPMFVEIQSNQSETNEYREAIAKATESNVLLQDLIRQKNSFRPLQLERLEVLVPDSINEVRILVDLEEIARAHNMLIGNISVEEADDVSSKGPSNQVPGITFDDDFLFSDISFSLIGTYDQFRSMLKDLEQSLLLMEIMDISFDAIEGDLQQFEVTIRAYALTSSVPELSP